jgi:hypothetical protein
MARTQAQSQPQDASQEPRAGETPLEQREAREVNEMDAQLTGAEDLFNVEHARVPGDLIQGSGLVNGSGNAVDWLMAGEVLEDQMRPALPQPLRKIPDMSLMDLF